MKSKDIKFRICTNYELVGFYFMPTTEDRLSKGIFPYATGNDADDYDYYTSCRESTICELQVIDDKYKNEKRKSDKRLYTGILFAIDGKSHSLDLHIREETIFDTQAAIRARKLLNIIENYMGWSKTRVSKVRLNEEVVKRHEKINVFLFDSSPLWRTSTQLLSLYYLLIRISVCTPLIKDIDNIKDMVSLIGARVNNMSVNNTINNTIYFSSELIEDLHHVHRTINYWKFLLDNYKVLFKGNKRNIFHKYSHVDGIRAVASGNTTLLKNEDNKKLYEKYQEKNGLKYFSTSSH